MKLIIVFIAVCIGLVASETCSSPNDCNWEHCSGGWTVGCHSGTCTCDDPNNAGQECAGILDSCRDHQCQGGHRAVCINHQCRCGFGGFLQGGGGIGK